MSDVIYSFDDFFEIEEIKKQCRVWHDEDNSELELFTVAAIEDCSAYLNREILKSGSANDSTTCSDSWPIVFNMRIRAAVLLMVSDLYENREANLSYSINENHTLKRLLDPMRDLQVRFK